MPNNASAKKRVRQTKVRTLRNKVRRTAMRSSMRRLDEAVTAGNKDAAQAELQVTYKLIDKAAKHHVLHANTAANQKSKLARRVARLS